MSCAQARTVLERSHILTFALWGSAEACHRGWARGAARVVSFLAAPAAVSAVAGLAALLAPPVRVELAAHGREAVEGPGRVLAGGSGQA